MMTHRTGGRTAAIGAVLALTGAAAVVSMQSSPASASTLTENYSCSTSGGSESVTFHGSLTATPNPATSGSAVSFVYDITSTNMSSPTTIKSWSATATIAGSGAQSSSFPAKGSGGKISSGNFGNVKLKGSWTPTKSGSDSFKIGNITVKVDLAVLGTQNATCKPTGTVPVAETLSVSG